MLSEEDSLNRHNIIALATPQGKGAIALIRISGADAIALVSKVFYFKNQKSKILKNRFIHFGEIIINKEIIDEVLISVFECPNSYTGENLVEISCHCSTYIINTILNYFISCGVHVAKAGEFTQRAFLNGKLKLTQAEAVADLIHSETKAAHQSAINSLKGHIQHTLVRLRNELIKFAALIELELDFSQEDVEFVERDKFIIHLNHIKTETQKLIHSFKTGNAIKTGIKIVIAGKPNVGKSTLLNQFLKEDKAIVSPIAGTTRDVIEDSIFYKDIKIIFLDTAGIRQHTNDEIEKIGIAKTNQHILKADLVLYLIDYHHFDENEIIIQEHFFNEKNIKHFFVINKYETQNINLEQQCTKKSNLFLISAQKNIGVDFLLDHIYNHIIDKNINKEDAIITNVRHYDLLIKINNLLDDVLVGIKNNLSGDLLSIEIKHILQHIGELTGEVNNNHLLDFIFREFCIGK